MWYAVFSRSIVAMVCGSITLLGYIGIHMTRYTSGFYSLLPLPFCIAYFWHRCKAVFHHKTTTLSLEDSIEIDSHSGGAATASFRRTLYCQPALVEGEIAPDPYRRPASASASAFNSPASSSEASALTSRFDEELEREQHLAELIDLVSPISLTCRHSPERPPSAAYGATQSR